MMKVLITAKVDGTNIKGELFQITYDSEDDAIAWVFVNGVLKRFLLIDYQIFKADI